MLILDVCFLCDRLVAVLENVLAATSKTMKLLHESCDEAQNLLSNWHISDASVCEQLPNCTCNDDESDTSSEITEMVKDIEQVVEQAQKLRKTLSASQPRLKSLPLTKISNTAKISQLEFTYKNCNDSIQKKPQSTKISSFHKPLTTANGPLKRSVNNSVAKRCSLDNYTPRAIQTNTNQQSVRIPILSGNRGKKSVTKLRLKPGPSLQTTYQKDFSLHKNCSTAKHKTGKGCTSKPKESSVKDQNTAILWSKNTNGEDMERDTKKSNRTFSEKMEISNLEDLLSRVTIYPNVSVNPDIEKHELPQVKLNSCLLHDYKTVDMAKNGYRSVKMAEAVDVLGVPSDLVKVLKTYHHFCQERQNRKKHESDAGKGHTAARIFLNKLSAMVSYSK
jgi:hypothetical protein